MEKNQSICQVPEMIEFDLSNLCNLKCVTCMRARFDYEQGAPEFLSFENFKTILDKIPVLGIVQICGSSEPTLNPDLPSMINYAKESGARVVEMFTNGTTLHGKILNRLVASKLDCLKVSIDGGNEETYKRVRGFDLSRVIDNVRDFHERNPIPITIESILSKQTVESIGELPAVVKRMGGSFLEARLLNWVDPHLQMDSIYDLDELLKIKQSLKKICDEIGIVLIMHLPGEGVCGGCTTFNELYVDFRGNVTPCYYLNRKPLGNLINEPFDAIWNGKRILKYRNNYINSHVAQECCCSYALLHKKVV